MAFRIQFTFLKPRIWLLAAAMVAVAAICFHYYQAQMDATRTLAMRLGLPTTVAIEDFRPMRDSNQMYEVQLAAKMRPSDTRLVAGTEDPPLYILPLYATDASFSSDVLPAPYGFYLTTRETGEEGLAAFGITGISDLGDATLVNVIGTRVRGQTSLGTSPYNIQPADLGLDPAAFLVAGGLVERAAQLGNPDVTPFRDTLILVAVLLSAAAIVSYVHGRREIVIGRPEQKSAPEAKSPRSKKAFLPLASQDEIVRTDEAERARKRRSRLSFVANLSLDPGAGVRNQQ